MGILHLWCLNYYYLDFISEDSYYGYGNELFIDSVSGYILPMDIANVLNSQPSTPTITPSALPPVSPIDTLISKIQLQYSENRNKTVYAVFSNAATLNQGDIDVMHRSLMGLGKHYFFNSNGDRIFSSHYTANAIKPTLSLIRDLLESKNNS